MADNVRTIDTEEVKMFWNRKKKEVNTIAVQDTVRTLILDTKSQVEWDREVRLSIMAINDHLANDSASSNGDVWGREGR